MGTHSGEVAREDADGNRPGCWEPIRAKWCNGVRVCRIAANAVRIRRKGIHYAAVRKRLCASRRVVIAEHRGHRQPWVSRNIRRNGDLFSVVAQPVTTANRQFVLESLRAPGETDLRSKIAFFGIPGIALPNNQVREVVRSSTGDGHEHVAFLGREWTKVGPAQAKIDSQVPAEFEVILDEEAQDVFALVLANRCWKSGRRIEALSASPFALRRVIEEVPHIEEAVSWHAARG